MRSQVGAYDLVRQLGEGGMGAVFEGVHRQSGRRVAIKMLLPALSQQPDVVGRFFNEARAVSLIRHPSVIEIFEVAQLPDGSAYMVMELLQGETLAAHLRQCGRLGVSALPIVREIAVALVVAHQKRIIHRDLKPDNVMLVPAPTGLRVKVLDFGIAKIAEDAELAGAGRGVRTKTGMVFGTPAYMSPEQCRGSGGVGAPTDVYAMGAMLHQLIAGQPPFVAAGVGEVLAMQIYEPPPPLSSLVPDVDPALERLTSSMLDKEPERRPSMAAVLRAIDGLLGAVDVQPVPGKPTVLMSSPRMTILSPPSRRARWWLAVGGATALAAGATLVTLLRQHHEAPTPTIAAEPAPPPVATAAAAAATPPAGPARTVLWLVKSEPTHADVVRVSDGRILGQTPWYVEQPSSHGTVDVIVRKSGWNDQHATLDGAANTTLHVRLDRRATTGHRARGPREDELDVKPLR